SKLAALRISTASAIYLETARLLWRVAIERIYTLLFRMAFMRILSPSKAPPVFFLEGSTEMIPICLSWKSIRNLLTISSTRELFPEPPVPVIPSTGIFAFSASSFIVPRIFCVSASSLSFQRQKSVEQWYQHLFHEVFPN